MESWPPDQARGFELPVASASLLINASVDELMAILGTNTNEKPWTQSPGLLYLPPLIDFSMPFNIMTLNR